MSPLERAIQHCGSQSELARRITHVMRKRGIDAPEVKTGHIYYWLNKRVPADRCMYVELATDGAVPCHELRPDAFPLVDAGMASAG